MNESMLKKLVDAGMTKPEAIVYLVLLEHPSMTIKEISSTSRLPRSTVTVAVEKLLRLDVIGEHLYGKRRNFIVNSVKAIEQYVNEEEKIVNLRKASLSKLIPDLQPLHFLSAIPGVEIEKTQGEEGFKDVYAKTLKLKRGEEVMVFGVEAEKFMLYHDLLTGYSAAKNKKGIHSRLLCPDTRLGRELQIKERENKDLRETRLLDFKEYNPRVQIVIWRDFVAFIIWDKSLEITTFKSKAVVDIFKFLFETTWKIAKK